VAHHSPDITKFGTILFVEKTGYYELLHNDFEIDKRFDIGLIQAQGYSNDALRTLVEKIQSKGDIPMLTLTDLDIAGIGIAADAKEPDELSAVDIFETRRIGVTLADVEEYDLPIEPVDYAPKVRSSLANKHDAGEVSDDVAEFLTANGGQRVEINAFRPAELEAYLETKFDELGIEKVHPETEKVKTPNVRDIEDLRNDARNEAVGEWVQSQAKADLLDSIESEQITDAEEQRDTDIGEGLADVPTGDTAAETIHEDLTEELSEYPREHWEKINRRMTREYQKKIDTETEEYKQEKKRDWLKRLNENFRVELVPKDKDDE
jgi:hypothetical protein